MNETQQMQEIEVEIENEPGALADVADRLGRQDINILGFMTNPETGRGQASFVTTDAERAVQTLEKAGYKPKAMPTLVVPTTHQPGELAKLARQLDEEDIRIERSFVATGREGESLGIGLRVNDPDRARELLKR